MQIYMHPLDRQKLSGERERERERKKEQYLIDILYSKEREMVVSEMKKEKICVQFFVRIFDFLVGAPVLFHFNVLRMHL